MKAGLVQVVLISISTLTLSLPHLADGQQQQQQQQQHAGTCSNDGGQTQGDASSSSSSSCRAPPQILTKGSFTAIDPSSFKKVTRQIHPNPKLAEREPHEQTREPHEHKRELHEHEYEPATIANIPGGETISLQYVQDFLTPELSKKLITICNQRNGWTTSPQAINNAATVNKATRTSSSCPLIWPQLYLPYIQDDVYSTLPPSKKKGLAAIRDEIEITWELTQRVASFLDVGEEYVEPFQIVRYQPGQLYKEHHDHGGYYGKDTEQRSWTLLVFLTDLPARTIHGEQAGGYTKFRALGNDNDNDHENNDRDSDSHSDGVSIVPRMGDGVLWRNEDELTGEVLLDAVHEAVPPIQQQQQQQQPNDEVIIKYAMNVWIAKDKIQKNLDVSSYRTK